MPVVSQVIREPDWLHRYGVTAAGAVLVRPDGHVTWRQDTQPTSGAPSTHDQLLAALKTSTAN